MYMFSAFTYIIIVHCQTRFDLLFTIIMNCVTYSVLHENLTCSISTRLISPGKTWKMDINGPGKSWKTTFSFCMHPVGYTEHICLTSVGRLSAKDCMLNIGNSSHIFCGFPDRVCGFLDYILHAVALQSVLVCSCGHCRQI